MTERPEETQNDIDTIGILRDTVRELSEVNSHMVHIEITIDRLERQIQRTSRRKPLWRLYLAIFAGAFVIYVANMMTYDETRHWWMLVSAVVAGGIAVVAIHAMSREFAFVAAAREFRASVDSDADADTDDNYDYERVSK